jgi:hypothetical protein
MKNAVVFKLKKGMKDGEVEAELHGRTSGESRQELQSFLHPRRDVETLGLPTLEVLGDNGEYALVTSREITTYVRAVNTGIPLCRLDEPIPKSISMPIGEVGITIPDNPNADVEIFYVGAEKSTYLVDYQTEHAHNTRDYIAGINDEGRYFVHPIDRIYNASKNVYDFEEMINYLNRTDQGFSKRIQGDLLLQFIPITRETRHYTEGDYRMHYESPGRNWNLRYDADVRIFVSREGVDVRDLPKSISLGNHTVSTDGLVLPTKNRDYLIVDCGSQVVIQHPQHGIVVENIPKHHYALITGQRGRDLRIESHGSGNGFD